MIDKKDIIIMVIENRDLDLEQGNIKNTLIKIESIIVSMINLINIKRTIKIESHMKKRKEVFKAKVLDLQVLQAVVEVSGREQEAMGMLGISNTRLVK